MIGGMLRTVGCFRPIALKYLEFGRNVRFMAIAFPITAILLPIVGFLIYHFIYNAAVEAVNLAVVWVHIPFRACVRTHC